MKRPTIFGVRGLNTLEKRRVNNYVKRRLHLGYKEYTKNRQKKNHFISVFKRNRHRCEAALLPSKIKGEKIST